MDGKKESKEKFGNIVFNINNNNGWVNCLDVLDNQFIFGGN